MNKNLYYVSSVTDDRVMCFSIDELPNKRRAALARKFTTDYRKLDQNHRYTVMTVYDDLFSEKELKALLKLAFKKQWKKLEIERADLPMSPLHSMDKGKPVLVAGQLRLDPWQDYEVQEFKKEETGLPWDLCGVIYPKQNWKGGEGSKWTKTILPLSRQILRKIF